MTPQERLDEIERILVDATNRELMATPDDALPRPTAEALTPDEARQVYLLARGDGSMTNEEATRLIRMAQQAGQPGLSAWQIEGMAGQHHGRASGCLSHMEDDGLVYRVPGLTTVIPETGNLAAVYAMADRPYSAEHQLSLGVA